jgi:hypothetical protein
MVNAPGLLGEKIVRERMVRSAAQVTARDVGGGQCEISLSPNPGVWTFVPFNFPTTFVLAPGSVIWVRSARPPGDVLAVDVSILVWAEPANPDYKSVSRRRKGGK